MDADADAGRSGSGSGGGTSPRRAPWAAIASAALAVLLVGRLWLSSKGVAGMNLPGTLLSTQQAILHVPIVVMAVLFFKRSLSPLQAAGCVAAAIAISQLGLIDEHLHAFMGWSGLYPAVIRSPQSGFVNPQYAKIFLYGFLLPPFLVLVLLRRFRTLDRLFALVCAGVSFGAVMLIHFVLIHGALAFAGDQDKRLMESINLNAGREARSAICRDMGWECTEGRIEDVRPDVSGMDKEIEGLRSHALDMPTGPDGRRQRMAFSWQTTGALDKGQVRSELVSFASDGTHWRAIVDPVLHQSYLDKWKVYFSVLAGSAQTIWTFGGLWLLFWHKSRAERKARARS